MEVKVGMGIEMLIIGRGLLVTELCRHKCTMHMVFQQNTCCGGNGDILNKRIDDDFT